MKDHEYTLPCFLITYSTAGNWDKENFEKRRNKIQLSYDVKNYDMKVPGIWFEQIPGTQNKWLVDLSNETLRSLKHEDHAQKTQVSLP